LKFSEGGKEKGSGKESRNPGDREQERGQNMKHMRGSKGNLFSSKTNSGLRGQAERPKR